MMYIETKENIDSLLHSKTIFKAILIGINRNINKRLIPNIEKEIKEEFNIKCSFYDIVEAYIANFKVNKTIFKNKFLIGIDDTAYFKGIKLNSIIKLIDYGNIKNRGFNIFNGALNFVFNNISQINKAYALGVL